MSGADCKRRVVVTGMGVIAPNGKDLVTFWESIRDGRSAAVPLTRFPAGNLPSRVAAEVATVALIAPIHPPPFPATPPLV